jgi:hypothetical protein
VTKTATLVFAAATLVAASLPAYGVVSGGAGAPAALVDPNTTTSPWAGVGSLSITGAGIFGAAVIDRLYVITAAHVVSGKAPGDITFNLNFGSSLSSQIKAAAVHIHPDYHGFVPDPTTGLVYDDIAIVRLTEPVPTGVPVYALQRTPIAPGTLLALVGYGTSMDLTNGTSVGPNSAVKRVGYNKADAFSLDDEGSRQREVYVFDFDGPDASTNRIGPNIPANLTLGEGIEATLAGGDSGSPAFVQGAGGQWLIAGVSGFIAPGGPDTGKFGTFGGGTLVGPSAAWIDSVLAAPIPEPSVWLQMLAGLALVGAALVRARRDHRSS